MAMQNIFNILVDVKVARSITQPLVTQNDSVVFVLEVVENGIPFDLTDTTTVSLAHTRRDGTVVVTPGTKVGNRATFELGTNETAVAGSVIAKAQFYDASGRVSTLSFSYTVGADPTGADYVPSETEQTLIQVVMADAQAKIDELSQVDVVDLSLQLADKVTKGQVSVADVNKNLGKFDQTYMTDEFIQQIAGTTPVNAIPADGSITLTKTAFAKTGKNLFNPNTKSTGFYVNNATGALDASASYTATDYIKVAPSTQYTRSWDGRTAFYDANKVYISGHYDINALTDTITTPVNCVYMRCSILNTKLSVYQIEVGNAKTFYEAYKILISKDMYEKDFDINLVPVSSIGANKTDFATLGKNLFDKATATTGYYVNQTTGLTEVNALHVVSGFTDVLGSTQYSLVADSSTRIAYYDINKVFISGAFPAVSPVTTPVNAKYVRISFLLAQLNAQQFESGAVATSYEGYGYKFVKQAGNTASSFVPEIKLPTTIYALVGKEVNVYFQNIFNDDISKYQVDVTCTVGVHQTSRWTLNPTAIGTHALTITIYKDYVTVASASTSVVIKASAVGTGVSKKALIIGDSTVNDPNYTTEVVNLFGASEPMNLTLLGTRGTGAALHEGRPGWTSKMYLDDASFGGVTNAFYNSGFDFSYYMAQQAYTGVNYVGINLGINDTFSFTDDATLQTEITLILNRLQTMINSIKAYDANIKIGMLATIPPSFSQDAFGKSYANGQNQWRYKRNNFLWAKAYMDYFKGKEAQGIYVVPVNTNLDTVNNMPTETVQLNSRNTTTIARQNNGVHPADIGYFQMADVLYYWLKSFEV